MSARKPRSFVANQIAGATTALQETFALWDKLTLLRKCPNTGPGPSVAGTPEDHRLTCCWIRANRGCRPSATVGGEPTAG